ncbi:MAG: urate hydroxylase PuuD [Deltaproteobacteria bacterium]|nr:urate hydroxylase PuuD [Deltaproteobacteria bacterium]
MTTIDFSYFVLRFLHFFAGITWIGLLYYFNFVQVPFMAETDAVAKPHVISKLVPRALWWFRWGAMGTFIAGLGLLSLALHNATAPGVNPLEVFYAGWFGWGITFGTLLATTMFLNVWLVIWPKQQIVMASNAAVMGGGQANPEAPKAARRAFLASRTNTLFSISMLTFMVAPRWLLMKAAAPSMAGKMIVLVYMIALVGIFEFSALTGDKGPLTKPLDTVKSVLTTGFVLAIVSLAVFLLVP